VILHIAIPYCSSSTVRMQFVLTDPHSMKLQLILLFVVACSANPSTFLEQLEVSCGSPAIKPDTSTNVYGGKVVIPYSWPWQINVINKQNGITQHCGGTIISNQWILTAAHCFMFEANKTKYGVQLGVFNKTNIDEPGQQHKEIAELLLHPKWDTKTLAYDIALLKLENPVEFTDHISPICLPTTQGEKLPEPGTTVFMTGWGLTEKGRDSQTLKQASSVLKSDEECKKGNSQFNSDMMLCEGSKRRDQSTCIGDSGGPIVFQDPQNGGRWKQIGVTSFGPACIEPIGNGIYAKVSAAIDFVKEHVKDL